MPVVTQNPARAYAHCRTARCPGYQQQEVAAVREEVGFTYRELNGNKGAAEPFDGLFERSSVRFRFEDESEAGCPVCGETREVTGEPRPSYPNVSGEDPMGLLAFGGFSPSKVVAPGEETTVQLQAEMADLREQIAQLVAAKDEE
jgi:hypothetical protein